MDLMKFIAARRGPTLLFQGLFALLVFLAGEFPPGKPLFQDVPGRLFLRISSGRVKNRTSTLVLAFHKVPNHKNHQC